MLTGLVAGVATSWMCDYLTINYIIRYLKPAKLSYMADKMLPLPVSRGLRDMGESIRAWRKLNRLQIKVVAERANVSEQTVMRIEHGHGGVSLENLLRVARAVGCLPQLVASVDPENDEQGKVLLRSRSTPTRVR